MAFIKPRLRARSLGLSCAVGFLCSAGLALAGPPEPPTSTEDTRRLLTLVSDAGPFQVMEAGPQGYHLGLMDDSGHMVGSMRLDRGSVDRTLRFHSRSFGIRIGNLVPDEAVVEKLIRAAHLIAERDDGAWAIAAPPTPPTSWWSAPGRAPDEALVEFTTWAIAAAVLLGLWKRGKVSWQIKIPHLLPATIQVVLFAYWGLYWPAVIDHVPSIVVQLVLGFAIDAIFAFARFGSWRIGASPLPIVLSSNLFAWFNTTGVLVNLIIAFASKTYIHRQGRHVFNPSSLGLAAAGIAAVAVPQWVTFGGVFHTMNIAPNLMELVVLLAILPQTRFRIVPVSIAAMLALQFQGIPGSLRPSMLLALALLATDPATIPRTDFGKLLFGLFLGFAMPFTSLQLRAMGTPDDFSKVIPIPIANLCAPAFDLIGDWIWRQVSRAWVLGVRWYRGTGNALENLANWRVPDLGMIGIWLLIVVPGMWREKPQTFEPTMLWTMGTPHVIRDADDVPRCERNPLFCKPFSFVREAALWWSPADSNGPPIPSFKGPPAPVVQAAPQGGMEN